MAAAFAEVDRAFIATAIMPNTVELFQNFFDAAQQTTGAHIVKFSALGAGDNPKSVVQKQHSESDEVLIASGLPYTILRPNSFYQNMLWSVDSIRANGQFYQPLGDAKQSFVDVRDITEVSFKAFTEPGHQGKIYELTGPESLSYHDVAEQLGGVIGKGVTYVPVPNEAALQGMLDSRMPEWTAKALADLYAAFATGEYAEPSDTMQTILGRPATSFATWASAHKAAFV